MSSGGDSLANTLLTSLIAGKSFAFPAVNLDDPLFSQPDASGPIHGAVSQLTIADLTSGTVGGEGAFDVLMTSIKAHLKEEYNSNRISGAEYTKAYIGLVTAGLSSAVQLLLGKDQAYWQALLLREQAKIAAVESVKARVELANAKLQAVRAQYEAATTEANYALTKLKLATEDATYGNLTKQGEGITYTNVNILPLQKNLLSEQVDVQRAQTMDSRTDGLTVVGVLGKQKDLYSQQIASYVTDGKLKGAKLFTDAWITQKTVDEGLLAPNNFTNTNVDAVLSSLRTNLSI